MSPDKRPRDPTAKDKVLINIGEELKELRILYKKLVEKLIPAEEPTSEEKRAIEEKDEIADETEIMKALAKISIDT
jgi:hypothetical protein